MSESTYEICPRFESRLELLNCPGCDLEIDAASISLHEETLCSNCGVTLLLVKIDGVLMFFRDGWL